MKTRGKKILIVVVVILLITILTIRQAGKSQFKISRDINIKNVYTKVNGQEYICNEVSKGSEFVKDMKLDDEITILVHQNSTIEYLWDVSNDENMNLISKMKISKGKSIWDKFKSSDTKEGENNDRVSFTFKPVKEGESILKFKYIKADMKPKDDDFTFNIKVNVHR